MTQPSPEHPGSGSELPIIDTQAVDDTDPPPQAVGDVRLRCDRCLRYVGFPAASELPPGRPLPVPGLDTPVAREHAGDPSWLAGHCWGCGRPSQQIAAEQRAAP